MKLLIKTFLVTLTFLFIFPLFNPHQTAYAGLDVNVNVCDAKSNLGITGTCVESCDLQPNNVKIYKNTKAYPYLELKDPQDAFDISTDAEGALPKRTGHKWIIRAYSTNQNTSYRELGEIHTSYVDVRSDNNPKVLFDSDAMIINEINSDPEITESDAVTYSKMGGAGSVGEKWYIIAYGGGFICKSAGDEWAIIAVNDPKIPDPGQQTATFSASPVDTSLGKLSTEPFAFANEFVRIAIGIAGGVSFLLLVFGAFRLTFAGGNPESIENGRHIITAAIIGLLVVVFSVFLVRLIGVNILGLPL